MNKNKKLYSITLKPYRSLNKIGFITMMVVLCGFSFITGIIFMKKGAWPVFGFFGLDILLVYIFFRLSYKSGKEFEVINLTKKKLIIKKYKEKKIIKTYILDANWVKIQIQNPLEHSSKLQISSKNKSIIIGSFLRLDEKIEVLQNIENALRKHNFCYAA
jgi:uncharacterized membrane protein